MASPGVIVHEYSSADYGVYKPTSHVLMNHRYMRSWDGTIPPQRVGMLVDVGAIVGWKEEVAER